MIITHNRIAVVFGLCLLFFAAAVSARDGRVLSITGDVEVNGKPMTPTTAIETGDVIVTDRRSSARVIMSDRTVLDIRPNTEFKVSDYRYNASRPGQSRSSFALLKGAFRYISGLIARANPRQVSVRAATATIGIRGSFMVTSLTPTDLTVEMPIGSAEIEPDVGISSPVGQGNTGTYNVQTGQTRVAPTTLPDPVGQAAIQVGLNFAVPDAINRALSGLDPNAQLVAVAGVINNAPQFKMTDPELVEAVGFAVRTRPDLAPPYTFLGGVLRPDLLQKFIEISIRENPGASDATIDAGKRSTNLEDAAPDIILKDTSAQDTRTIDSGDYTDTRTRTQDTGTDTRTGSGGGGTPSERQIQEVAEELLPPRS